MSVRYDVGAPWRVPLTDVQLTAEDVEAVLECLRSGWLTMGPRIADFERAFADYVGSAHAVAVSSGTAALHLALLAANLGAGDEVIVPNLTFVASASAVRLAGAEPVLCDIVGEQDLTLDVTDFHSRIGPRTRAVIAVHFCGYSADLGTLRSLCDEHGLVLIEDCAQAVGAGADGVAGRVGSVGALGCFSLFSKKQLGVGEGGVVTTDDPDLAARARLLRSHAMTTVTWDRHRGHAYTYDIVDLGYNYRLDEPRAALALSRMAGLEAQLDARRERVFRYRDRLRPLAGVVVPWTPEQVARASPFAFPVLFDDRRARDRMREHLRERGIQTTWYPAISTFTDYRQRHAKDRLPRSVEAAERHCALPLSGTLAEADVDLVVSAVEEGLTALARG